MRRLNEGLTLVTEHRSAQSMAPLSVALVNANGKPPHLDILATAPAIDDLEMRLLARLIDVLVLAWESLLFNLSSQGRSN